MDIRYNIDILFTHTMGNTNGSTSDTTLVYIAIGSQYTTFKEEAREGRRYNMAVRGYCNVSLTHRKRFFGVSLCFYNVFTIRFNMIT